MPVGCGAPARPDAILTQDWQRRLGSMMAQVPPEITQWFAGRGWRVRRHQLDMLEAADSGRHAMLVADTGAGKTLAGFMPTLAAFCPSRDAAPPDGLHTLY